MEKKIITSIFVAGIGLILSLIFLDIPLTGGFLGVQQEYILDLNNVSFRYNLTKFNDSNITYEFDFLNSTDNHTFYLSIPKNAKVQNISMNLTGKITTIYTTLISIQGLLEISIGNITSHAGNEVAIGSGKPDPNVYIITGFNGSYLWNYTLSSQYNDVEGIEIGNITEDFGNELAFTTESNKVIVLNTSDDKGEEVWNYTLRDNGEGVDIGDVTGDSKNEVVATDVSGWIFALNSTGGLMWEYQVSGAAHSVVIANITSESGNEVVVGADKLYVINSTGNLSWTKDLGATINSLSVGEVSSEHQGNEIVVGCSDNKVYLLNSSGEIIWNITLSDYPRSVLIEDATSTPAGNEIVAGANDGMIYATDQNGSIIWKYRGKSYIESIDVGEVTSDEGNEVAAGGGDGTFYVFNFDYFPTNLTIFINETEGWNKTGKLRDTTIATGQNFVSEINNYLEICTQDSKNNCQVPLIFHSDFKGKLNISNLKVEYNYNVSDIITKKNVTAWSRISNIEINESVGSKVYNITFEGTPAENITIRYIVVNQSVEVGSKCDFNLTSYTVANVGGKKVCNISSNQIFLEGGESITQFSVLFWDSSMVNDTPIYLHNTSDYYSIYGIDNYKRRINLTLNATNGTFYNATAWWELNDSQIEGEEFLLVDCAGNGTFYDITPDSMDSSCDSSTPTYTEETCSGDTFYICKKKIGNNMYFKWKHPELSSPTNYTIGGSFNLPANLTNRTVSPNETIWGENFNFSVNVTDVDGDNVSLTLCVFNQADNLVYNESKNVSNGTIANFINITSDKNWTGENKFLFEYFDYNATNSSQIFHSARNTTNQTFTVLEHNVNLIYNENCSGNSSTVFRNATTNLSIFVNDTNSTQPVAGANCSLWVNNTLVNFTQTNSSGYCKFNFIPNQSFSSGNVTWKIGVLNDKYYNNGNSTNLNLTIKDWISPEILNETNSTFYINESTIFSTHLIDIYNSQANLSNYNCSFYLNGIGIGNNTTSGGVCSIVYTPNCSSTVGLKNLSVEIIGTHEFYNISDNQTSKQVILKDRLNLTILSPEDANYYKGQNITLNASAKNNCGNDTTDVLVSWYLVNKYRLNLTIKDTSGNNRTNYPIILNGSFFAVDDFELTDWRLNYTNISWSGEIPFSIYSWKTGDKGELNVSQEVMSNLTELVFLINLSANETKTFEIDLKKENYNTHNVSYNILNSGFDSGNFSSWNSSPCGNLRCYNNISGIDSNYTANLSANGGETKLVQKLPNFTYSDKIKIKYKAWGEFNEIGAKGEFYIKVGNGICNLTPDGDISSEPENWTIANCTNTSFNSARNISIVLTDTGDGGTYTDDTHILVDYLCFTDENGNCINFHSGKSISFNLTSKKKIGENQTTHTILNGTEEVGRRKIIAEAEKGFFDSDKKIRFFNLTGFAYAKNLTVDSDFCTPINTTNYNCMQNASLTLVGEIADNFTNNNIKDYNVSFYNSTSSIGNNLTNVSGLAIMDSSVGGAGVYNFSCNITDQLSIFYNATEPKRKELIIEVKTDSTNASLKLTPNNITSENITIENNSIKTVGFFLNNTGNGSMFNVNIVSSNITGIIISEIVCAPIPIGKNCSKSFNVIVTADALAGNNHTINFNVTWQNGDMTSGNVSSNLTVFVEPNKEIKFSENNLSLVVPIKLDRTTNFTLQNYGNVNLINVTLNLTGNSSIINITSFNNTMFNISKFENETISVTVNAYSLNSTWIGAYNLNITADAENCTQIILPFTVNITKLDWSINSGKNISETVSINKSGKLGNGILIENTKTSENITLNLSIIPIGGTTINYLGFYSNGSTYREIIIPGGETTIDLFYNTTYNISEGVNKTHNYTVKIKSMDGSAPSSDEVKIQLTVINFTIDILYPTNATPLIDISAGYIIPPTPNYITVEARKGSEYVVSESEISFDIYIGGEKCNINSSEHNSSVWFLKCKAPEIDYNPIYNDLTVVANYTELDNPFNVTEEDAIIYKDIKSPWFSNVSTTFANQLDNLSSITFEVNVTDNFNISSVWAVINHTSGSSWDLNSSNYTRSKLDAGDFDKWNYNFTFFNPNILGDYDITVFANDTTTGNNKSSKKGWFDIYLPVDITGNLTDPNGNPIAANFTFYREGYNLDETYKMHENNTEATEVYNWTLHKRKYDVKVGLFGQEVILYNADFNLTSNETNNPFRFDYFPNKTAEDISNIQLPNTANRQNILLAIIVETDLTNTADFIIDYTDALNSYTPTENILEVFVCENWNYSSRTCGDGEFSYLVGEANLNSLDPNIALNLFNFSTNHLSAFAIAESTYPNIWGSSPPDDDSPSGGGSSGGSSADEEEAVCGNGVCEVGENWQNCPQDCLIEEFPLIIDTNIGDVRVFPGESKTYWLSLKNKLNKNVSTTLEITEGLQGLLSLSYGRKIIQPNKTEKIDIYLTILSNQTIGTYTGNIIIRTEAQKQNIPVTIRVLESAAAFYSVDIEIASKTISPKGNLDFIVKLINLGERKVLPINLTYLVKDQKTDKIIEEVKTNTTLETTTIVRESLPLDITEEGSYTLEVWADYKKKSIMDIATFSVVKPLFESPLTVGLLILALAMAVAVGGTYIWRYYRIWKREKEKGERYLYPLDYRKVPREGFKIGKFAGTNNYCYYDPKDLTTHMIAAGATGAGKSVSASVFAEEALDKKISVIVFDPTAQWTGFVKSCKDKNLLRRYKNFDMNDFDIKSYPGLIYDVEKPDFKLNIKEFINSGEITVFCLNKLKSGEYDDAVRNIISSIFRESWEESQELKLVIIFDEVHRLLEKYGGKGGYVALEKAAREFRKWGIGIIMCSQVLADFKEAIAGNVLTEIQLNTKSLTDIDKVKTKYGEQYAERIARMGVGAGLMQYPKYNDGKPFFVEFRPTKHNPHKITDEELELYKKYTTRLKAIEEKIKKLKEKKAYTEDYEVDLKLATNKLKTGNFRMTEIYISSLEKSLEKV